MSGTFLRFVILMIALWPVLGVGQELVFEDSMAERTRACSHCHGKQGRAGPDGYYPRLAGKPAAYLYNQLRNFREGRRHYSLMTGLLEPLTDAYLMEMAQYFAGLNLPYPPPTPVTATTPTQLARGRTLVMQGDPQKKIPACTNCHGDRLTGALPHVPGLLGLPRDYLNAQLGGWQTGQRRAQSTTRTGLRALERDDDHGGIAKLNPLAAVEDPQLWAEVEARAVTVHPLHRAGYPSIGCAPCTRAVAPGDDPRSGRWWWEDPEHKECGLHRPQLATPEVPR